jgi:phospholipid/cholesterol/gamma-HCH transport system substrate-binding protein
VLLAAAILIVGILWLKNFQVAQKTMTISVLFPEVGGLQKGDAVQVNGVECGQVRTVALAGDKVRVTLALSQSVPIGRDARISIRDRGMMGEKFVLIRSPHDTPAVVNGDQLTGHFDAGMAEVMAMSGAMLQDLQGLTAQVNQLLRTDQKGQDLQSIIRDMAALTADLRAAAAENRSDVRAAVTGMRKSAAQMDALLRAHGSDVGVALRTATSTAVHMDSLTSQLMSLSASLQVVADQVRYGRGTIGQMVYDDSMYTVLTNTVQDASTLVTDMLKHPKKYFKFSLF